MRRHPSRSPRSDRRAGVRRDIVQSCNIIEWSCSVEMPTCGIGVSVLQLDRCPNAARTLQVV
jgi:hypothetical protein